MNQKLMWMVLVSLLVALLPVVNAEPQVLPLSTATVFVSVTDTISFGGGLVSAQYIGAEISVTAPDGESIVFRKGSVTAESPITWSLFGIPNSQNGWQVVRGNLSGSPVSGTWTMTFSGPGFAAGGSYFDNGGNSPGPTLRVGGKAIHFGVQGAAPQTTTQFWNWHITPNATTWNEPSTITVCSLPCAADTLNEAPDEDPNFAIYYQSPPGTPETPAPFTAVTGGYTAPMNCAGFANTTVTGIWFNGVNNISTRFFSRAGNFLGTNDLRSIPDYISTTPIAQGNVSNGTTNASIAYNNVVGTSYQFMANNSTTEALGSVQWVPNGACTNSLPQFDVNTTLDYNNNVLHATASQAQCREDPVVLSVMMQDTPAGLQEHVLHVYVFDSGAGGFNLPPDPIEVAYFNTTTMHRTGPASQAHSHYVEFVFAPGGYEMFALVDYTGVGAQDYADSFAFNVPVGTCIDIADSNVINTLVLTTLFLNTSITDTNNSLNNFLEDKFGPQGEPVNITTDFWPIIIAAIVLCIGAMPQRKNFAVIAFSGLMFVFGGIAVPFSDYIDNGNTIGVYGARLLFIVFGAYLLYEWVSAEEEYRNKKSERGD